MTQANVNEEGLDDEQSAIVLSGGAIGAITRSEVETQIAAAHRFPRSIQRFLRESAELATLNEDTAESCIYTLTRSGADGKKLITGPSVRLAEIVTSAWGNMHSGSRIVDEDDKAITAQGLAWDLQRNNRITIETKRRITKANGHRYSDDMVIVAGNAAAAIAFRNAIFKVIPRAYVNQIFDHVRKVVVGDAKTLSDKRIDVVDKLVKIGVPKDRIFARLAVNGIHDITLEHVEALIGLGASIKNGERTLDEAFPPAAAPAPAAPAEDGKRISLKKTDEKKTEGGSGGEPKA